MRTENRTVGWLLVFLLIGQCLLPAAFAQSRAETGATSSRAFQKLFDQVGGECRRWIPVFVQALNKTRTFDISVHNLLYDARLRRVFLEFKGKINLPPRVPTPNQSLFLTSDGMVAFDIFYEKSVAYRSAKVIAFHGDVVISLEKVLYEFAKDLVLMAGSVGLNLAGEHIIEFLQKIDSHFLAEALHKAVTRFSREAVAVAGAEVMHNAARDKNSPLRELIRGSIKDRSLPTFIALTLLKSTAVSLAGVSGASLGAAAGNVLLPGIGGVIGAFVGNQVATTAGKTLVHKVTVDVPMSILLRKLVKFSARLQASPRDEFAHSRLEQYRGFIVREIRREIESEDYQTLDRLLKKIHEFSAPDRVAFIPLLKEIQEILRFKLMEEGDWYAGKKILQFRERIRQWGLESHFSY